MRVKRWLHGIVYLEQDRAILPHDLGGKRDISWPPSWLATLPWLHRHKKNCQTTYEVVSHCSLTSRQMFKTRLRRVLHDYSHMGRSPPMSE